MEPLQGRRWKQNRAERRIPTQSADRLEPSEPILARFPSSGLEPAQDQGAIASRGTLGPSTRTVPGWRRDDTPWVPQVDPSLDGDATDQPGGTRVGDMGSDGPRWLSSG